MNTFPTTHMEHATSSTKQTPTIQDFHHNNIIHPDLSNHNNTNNNASHNYSKDTSRDPIVTNSHIDKHMDIDEEIIRPSWNVDIVIHTNAAQQIVNTDNLIHNPWSDNVTPQVISTNQYQQQMHEFKSVLDLRQDISFNSTEIRTTPKTTTTAPSHTHLDTKDVIVDKVKTVDSSRFAPPNCKNLKSQTFDSRVPVSEIPGFSHAEKLSILHGFFRDSTMLKDIYIDEI